ncbi:Aste57867_24410 [Aphanomyces stellatus]|uniref:Aste57867_24410 protein n=1 Tax=Aphanomyces stellatus TaxID=120398 RepID=A0A485LQC8_9STRA|nr:hypothetical protein As57867_024334 [Aphanomyces stellatus]VFU01050.1 Aste57867_24410 [Aphanomyces stellatus]
MAVMPVNDPLEGEPLTAEEERPVEATTTPRTTTTTQASDGNSPPGRVLFINDRGATVTAMAKIGRVYAGNSVRTSKYSILSFIPKNLMEQFRRVANFYFLIISLLQLCTTYSPTNKYSTIGPLMLVLIGTISILSSSSHRPPPATMIKEAIEDKSRHDADRAVNHARTLVYNCNTGTFQEKTWREIVVGDVVKVVENECFPADLVILESSNADGQVQVETANLDGETDLKIRSCPDFKIDNFHVSMFPSEATGEIRCEAPNRKLYTFDGVLKLRHADRPNWDVSLTITNVVLRGMKLSHTNFVVGVIVATGAETKLIQNTKQSPSKFSRLDVIANRCIMVIFSVLFVICCVSTALGTWSSHKYEQSFTTNHTAVSKSFNWSFLWNQDIAATFTTFLILYNNLVPISLYISLEVVKWYQAKKIESDPEMRDPITGKSVQARTSNLNEDVGQIRYLFSDKTGTITKNEMVLKLISLSNVVYDNIPVREKKEVVRRASFTGVEVMDRITTRLRAYSANVMGYAMLTQQGSYPDHGAGCEQTAVLEGQVPLTRGVLAQTFFRCVLLCHTATVAPETHDIRASSPDEAALLRGAIEFNCNLKLRTTTTIDICLFGKHESYEILALNEFDSTRKCMSIVVRLLKEMSSCHDELCKEDEIWVFCKGADTAMMTSSNVHSVKTQSRDSLTSHLHYFASMGLRTLIFGYKRLSFSEFTAWSAAYNKAKTSIVDRESKLLECARSMETHLTLLGATGVEDQLQDGVTECIETLSAAGINIWMLTGDKDETAISIANSCGLISDQSQLVVVNDTTQQGCVFQMTSIRKQLRKQGLWKPDIPSREIALVINGDALEALMNESKERIVSGGEDDDDGTSGGLSKRSSNEQDGGGIHHRDSSFTTASGRPRASIAGGAQDSQNTEDSDAALALFMQLVTQCCSVIACRLSPIHKAQIIALIKRSKSRPVTMAVGDGGNDVSMIQEAHIGVGIFGHEGKLILVVSSFLTPHSCEGMQAVRSADFAIGQFRFLSRLILAHGRWNYRRVSIVILFSFYKNMALILTLFLYSFVNGYSGQTMYESYLIVGWNVLYTLFPILVLGVVDEDISSETVLKYPFIFRNNQMGQELNIKKMRIWVGNALWHSFLVFLLGTFLTYFNLGSYSLAESSIFLYGTGVYGILVVTVSLKAAMIMQRVHRWTKYHYWAIIGGPVAYFAFVLLYSQAYKLVNIDAFSDFYGLGSVLFGTAAFWITIVLVAFTSILADVVSMYLYRMYLPTNQDIIEEIDSGLDVGDETMLKEMEASGTKIMAHALGDLRKELAFPTEHEELCRKLMRLERAVAREVGVHRQEVFDVGIASASQITLHPITVEFMGEGHEFLEMGYNKLFVSREVRRIHVLLVIFLFLLPVYAVIEYFWEKDKSMYVTRIGMFVVCFVYLVFLHSRFFVEHYQLAILMPMMLGGIAFTQAIEYTGLLLVTIFTIILFSVVRVKVVYAVFLALFNLTYFDLSPEVGFRPKKTSSESTTTEIVLFLLFMVRRPCRRVLVESHFALQMILIGCAAFGSYLLQVSMRTDYVQNRILVYEERRSREILSNMLPEHIVRRMQNGDTLISEEEKDVTILFCDIGDFSSLIKRYSATEMVKLLDRIYSLFDAMCAKHGMRKMETVGKTYLACAGLQGSVRGKEAALRAAGVAQDMMAAISKVKASNGNGLKIRIGIHSGRVISGLVGMKKQQFSLFGDTINTASRMQSTGVTGRIQVSQVTYDYLCHDFRFEPRTVEAKGKGTLTAYLMGKSTTVLGDRAIKGHWEPFQDTAKVDVPRVSHRASIEMIILDHTRDMLRRMFSPSNRVEVLASAVETTELPPLANPDLPARSSITSEMQTHIDPVWLFFKDPVFELAYRKSHSILRQNGARRTMLMMGMYICYTLLRDLVHDSMEREYTNIVADQNATLCTPTCKASLYGSAGVRGCLVAFTAWYELVNFHWWRGNKVKSSDVVASLALSELKSFVRPVNVTIFVFYSITAIVLVVPNLLRWLNEQQSILYSYVSMDIIMLMFLVSSGGSLLNKYSTYYNFILVILTTIIYVYAYVTSPKRDPSVVEGLKVYPAGMTYFVALFSTMARRDVEFFSRRKYWFQTRAQMETKKADRLLYKMLPLSVVNQLKEGESVCDQHQNVGILFSDIKGFTSIAARADTDKVVHLLDSLFSAFDMLTEKHGVFKMQTIGDAYVIVSGLPYVDMSASELDTKLDLRDASSLASMNHKRSSPTEVKPRPSFKPLECPPPRLHIRNLIHMATDMQKEVAKVMDPNSGEPLQMRIGIHIGSIIAGVIGTSTLRYDMWGPEVLTANEMESNGVPGKILVSNDVKKVAEDCPDLRFTFHKSIEFTGISMMDTYIAEFVDEKPEKHHFPHKLEPIHASTTDEETNGSTKLAEARRETQTH